MVTIKSKSEIECMREAGRVAVLVQKEIEKAIKPGVTTLDLDKIADGEKVWNKVLEEFYNPFVPCLGAVQLPEAKKHLIGLGVRLGVDIETYQSGRNGFCGGRWPQEFLAFKCGGKWF